MWNRWFWALLILTLIVVFLAYQWTGSYSLDIGALKADDDLFIAGFHQRESSPDDDYRWTGPRALVSFPGLGRGRPWTMTLHLSGYRPPGQPSPQVSLGVNGHRLAQFAAHDGMAEHQFTIDASMIDWSGDLLVEIAPDVFIPESDSRQLGVLVSRITVTPAGPGILVPSPITLLLIAGSLAVLFFFLRWMGASAALSFWISLLPTAALGFVVALHRQYASWYALSVLLLLMAATISGVALHTLLQKGARRFRWQALADMNTRPLLGILLLALACNLALLPTPGFVGDMGIFMRWSWKLTTGGLHTAYLPVAPVEPIDYPPLIPYLLSIMGALYQRIFDPSFPYPPERSTLLFYSLLKLPTIAADIGTGVIIFLFMRRRTSQRLALLSMAAYLFNPAILFASAYGGQTDAIYSFFAVLAVVLILERRVIGAWSSIALAVLSKPQGAFFLPLILFLTWKRLGVRPVLKGLAVAIVVVLLVFSPFLYHGTGDSLAEYLFSVGRLDIPGMPAYTTLAAHNLWWVLGAGAEVVDIGGPWSEMPFIGTLLAPRILGLTLMVILYTLGLYTLWKSDDELLVPVVAAFVGFACFMTLTQVHARYAFSMLPFLSMALATAKRWRIIYMVLSITFLTNMALHDAALLDMLGLLEHERLLDPIKYLNALVNVGVLVYWAVVLSAGWRSGQVAVSRIRQEEGTA